MTIANQPVGWMPEKTDATFSVSNLAITTGDILRITPSTSTTYSGFDTASAVTTSDVIGQCYAVALEDRTTSDTLVRCRIRGRVNAFTYDIGTNPTANASLVAGQGDGASAVTDLIRIQDGTTTEDRKIIAMGETLNNSGGQSLEVVLFNGIEGFGTSTSAL